MTLTVYGTSLLDVWSLDGTTLGLIEATAANYDALVECCCNVACDCSGMTETLDVRIVWRCFGSAVCAAHDFPEALTEQAGTPSGGWPCPATPRRYWKGTITETCADPEELEIEVVCCGDSEPTTLYVRYSTDLASGWQSLGGSLDQCCEWSDDTGVGGWSDTGENCGGCDPLVSPSAETVVIKCTTAAWSVGNEC